MLNISAFYLVKQKSFIPKKYDLGRSQYQNKKALFTDPIFSDGFGVSNLQIVNSGSPIIEQTKKVWVRHNYSGA